MLNEVKLRNMILDLKLFEINNQKEEAEKMEKKILIYLKNVF